MAVNIINQNADFFGNALAIVPPVDGFVAWHYLGGDAAKSTRNLVDLTKPATMIGAPTMGAGFCGLRGNHNYFELPITEDWDSYTLIAVARSTEAFNATVSRPYYISNRDFSAGYPANLHGASLGVTGTAGTAPRGNLAGLSAIVNATPILQTALDVADNSVWRFVAFSVRAGENQALYDKTGGVSATTSLAGVTRLRDHTKKFRIGADHTTNGPTSDVAFAAICNRGLVAAEIETLYQFVKPYMARHATPILI